MMRVALLLALAGRPDGGVRYELSPCLLMGSDDAGVSGTVCDEPTRDGWVEHVSWTDGRRERITWTRLVDGGRSERRERWSSDGGSR